MTMKQILDRVAPYLPWLGFLLILAGAAAYFVTRRWDLVTNLLLAGGALLLLLFAIIQPNEVRELMSGRRARYGTSTLLSIVFFIAIAVLLYYIVYQNTEWRYDATETDEFTPLPDTVELLADLDEPIHVIGFYTFQLANQQAQAEALLESLDAYTNNLTYEFVDPEANPVLAEQYDLTFNGTLVFTQGEGEDEVFAKASSLSDRDIHTALAQVVNPVEKKLYFITGHGEPDIEDFDVQGLGTAARFLRETGFTIETLNLFVEGAVPEDAAAIALVNPQTPLTTEEVTAIRDYVNTGGAAFIARDTPISEQGVRTEDDALNTFLAEDWGINPRTDIVVEPVYVQAGQQFIFLGANYGASPVTGEDLEQFGAVFNLARSVGNSDIEGITKVNLVMTSEESWGETNFEALASQGVVEFNPAEDTQGPLNVGLSAEKIDTGARLIVFGDADFISNSLILQNGNSLLLTNALNWLAGDEVAVELTPRETVERQIVISQSQLGLLQLMSICLAPGLMALVGIGIWYSRRQTR
ncbi:MAG TPA: GldG family protein [Anaerolineae bacterium]